MAGWHLTALSAQTGYTVPGAEYIYCARSRGNGGQHNRYINKQSEKIQTLSSAWAWWR